MMRDFFLCFVPIFVAVDALGVLPIYFSLTEGLKRADHKKIILQSVTTAAIVALGFLFVGEKILRFIGITIPDFMVAGGLLLFGISVHDLLSVSKKPKNVDSESLGSVPIGVPLIVGPAVLTTILLLLGSHSYGPVVLALLLNIFLAGLIFLASPWLNQILGKAGGRTVSKIASLILAAFAVMMIRRGIMIYIAP